MTLIQQYRRQAAWRSWNTIFTRLPDLQGRTVLDLGCGIGDQAALLAARGARVIGLEQNEELLAAARAQAIPGVEFRRCNLAEELPRVGPVDGVWCSFTAAYFPALAERLAAWTRELQVGGWVALIEVDDLFGHEPVSTATRAVFDAYVDEALRAGRYDFRMGRKLAAHLQDAGLTPVQQFIVPDAELAPAGVASLDVIQAWRERLERMTLLRQSCGASFDRLREDFLSCLTHPEHRSRAQVHCVLGRAASPRHVSPSNPDLG